MRALVLPSLVFLGSSLLPTVASLPLLVTYRGGTVVLLPSLMRPLLAAQVGARRGSHCC